MGAAGFVQHHDPDENKLIRGQPCKVAAARRKDDANRAKVNKLINLPREVVNRVTRNDRLKAIPHTR